MIDTITIEIGRISSATIVIIQLMENIIIKIPMMVVTDVISCVALWLRLIDRVSTSFVTMESTSPVCFLSKKFIGRRLIFSEISRRMR